MGPCAAPRGGRSAAYSKAGQRKSLLGSHFLNQIPAPTAAAHTAPRVSHGQSEACPPQPDARVTQQWLRARCGGVSHASLPHLAGLADEYLFSSSCNETANGLAEKTGEERIERRLTVQEVVKKVEQSLVPSQPVTDLRHVTRQQLTGCVWVPEGAQCKQLEVSETSPPLSKLLE